MKKIIILLLCVVVISAIIPFCGIWSKFTGETGIGVENTTATADETLTNAKGHTEATETPVSQDEIVVSMAIDYLRDEYTADCKLAVLTLCHNNYCFNLENSKETEIINIANYSDSLYNELVNLYDKAKIWLTYNNERVYIPIVISGGLKSSTCDEYPYMESVASPWEYLSDDFLTEKDFPCGVSVYGLEYLTQNGYDFKEALSYYLPSFEIN